MTYSKLICACVVALLTAGVASDVAMAGSSKPNTPALKAEARKAREELRTAGMEIPGLYRRLASDHDFAAKYESAAMKRDTATMSPQLMGAGVTGRITSDDWHNMCYGTHICIALPESAAEARKRSADHAWIQQEAETFVDKLANDDAYDAKLQAALMSGERQKINEVLREGGWKRGEITDLTFDRDFHCHFKCSWFEIDFGW